MTPVTLRVATVGFRLEVGDAGLARTLAAAYAEFLCEGRADAVIRVRRAARLPAGRAGVRLGPDGAVLVRGAGFAGSFRPERGAGTLLLGRGRADDAAAVFLRGVLALLLLRERRGLVLHAASLAKPGQGALVFAGASGAGKSTIAGLAPRSWPVLNDEMTAVVRTRGGHRAYPVPFGGMRRGGAAAAGRRLEGVFFLRHLGRHAARRCRGGEAAARLLTLPALPPELLRAGDLLERCGVLAGAVPCFDLGFAPRPSVWACVERALARPAG